MNEKKRTTVIEIDLAKEIAGVLRLMDGWRRELKNEQEPHTARRASAASMDLRRLALMAPESKHSKIARRLDSDVTLVHFQVGRSGKIFVIQEAIKRARESLHGQLDFDDLDPNA